MTQTIRDWLPPGAITDEAIKAALAGIVAQWSERWFACADIGVRIAPAQAGTPDTQSISGGAAQAAFPEGGKRALLEAALGMNLSRQSFVDGDRRVLDAFAAQIVEDFIAALDKAFGVAKTEHDGACIDMVLSLSGSDLLAVSFPEHVIIPRIKTHFGGSRTARSAMRKRADALMPTRLTVEGVLGHAELAMSDLDELTSGDVVILDRGLNEAVELRVSGNGRVIGRGKLGRSDGRISIQF